MSKKYNPVVMVMLDATEVSLVEKWMADGSLPVLKGLRDKGTYGRVGHPDDLMIGHPWVTLYTGVSPFKHGLFFYIQWRPDMMNIHQPSSDWLNIVPFWRRFQTVDAPKTFSLDFPLVEPAQPFNGKEVIGWATHESLNDTDAYPPEFLQHINQHIGSPPRFAERYGLSSVKDLLETRDRLKDLTRQTTKLGLMALEQEDWDLFMISYAANHRAGHKLWGLEGALDDASPVELAEFEKAMKEVYVEVDQELGVLLQSTPPNATILALSVHGMGPNFTRTPIFPEMFELIMSKELGQMQYKTKTASVLVRLREMIPDRWRFAVKNRLPFHWQHKLTAYWRMRGAAKVNAPVMNIINDYYATVRVNLKGREVDGVVEPGAEYEAWLDKITEAVMSFRDADTGDPIVKKVLRASEYIEEGKYGAVFPDLVIVWEDSSVAQHRALRSPIYGEVAWPTPGKSPDGRSGAHLPEGFLVAVGNHFPAGGQFERMKIVDVTQLIFQTLGVDPFPEMEGQTPKIV